MKTKLILTAAVLALTGLQLSAQTTHKLSESRIKVIRSSEDGEAKAYFYSGGKEEPDSVVTLKGEGLADFKAHKFLEDEEGRLGLILKQLDLDKLEDIDAEDMEKRLAELEIKAKVLRANHENINEWVTEMQEDHELGDIKHIKIFKSTAEGMGDMEEELEAALKQEGLNFNDQDRIVLIKLNKEGDDEEKVEEVTWSEGESGKITAKISTYPNPAQNRINLSVSNIEDKPVQVNVYDEQGNKVLSKRYTPENGSLDEELSIPASLKGTYILKIEQGKKQWQKRLLLK